METAMIRKRMPVSALFDRRIVVPAIGSAFVKLNPRTLIKNPVMLVLEVVTALTTVILIRDLVTGGEHIGFEFQIVLWLWFTVLFANFAEAIAEGRGKAQAAALRRQRTETQAKLLTGPDGRGDKTYEPPTLVMFSGVTRSACGFAQSAMGPFYCPVDQKVYLDTSFFEDLQRRFHSCDVGSKSCEFSQAYVITHEIGHHVQNLLGILPRVQEAQRGTDQAEANQLQVRVELQADCFAGIWAHRAEEKWRFMEPGDVEAAIQTASAIGDDRLQRRSQGYVVPDAFTHGSSEQRKRWLMTGLKSGQVASCDTFQSARF
jgi:predicted metalloprotease